ncbi:MAG: 4Fe-4S binding protein [Candidatus Lokiarchaeota archaeon]|nr:4Fe-4S binding protein [Candidatus Lokiarchaeota archaeon]
MSLKSKFIKYKKEFKFADHTITIARRIVQIVAFVILNYVILELIFSVNLLVLDGLFKVVPFLSSPNNHLTGGAGIVEYIYYSFVEGVFPVFLIGILILILLLTNRFFCGWICPVGAIQDACHAIPTKNKKSIKQTTHKKLLKLKFVPVILVLCVLIPLFVSKTLDPEFYTNYKQSVISIAQNPLGYFSLSEFLFYTMPNIFGQVFTSGNLEPLFENGILFVLYIVYLAIIIGSVWYPRLYCKYFCPVGAIFSMGSKYSFLKLSRSPVKCVGRTECGICENACPKQIKILDEPYEFYSGNGECNFCLKCKEVCPYGAINIKFA